MYFVLQIKDLKECIDLKETMLEAIHQTRLVNVTFSSNEKGLIKRLCVPYDIGPSRKYRDGQDRYHFYDLNSPDGQHNLSILPAQIQSIEMTSNSFFPGDYVTWANIKWFVPRDWGAYS